MASRSIEEATTPRVAKYMAWRSRGITWVETGSTARPIALATWASTRGSICAKVPTAPEMAQVATSVRAAASRRAGTGKFRIGVGELEAERGGLGMDAVGAADHGRHLVFEGAALERGYDPVDVRDQKVGGAHQLHVEAGVEHVRGRHALVDEARLRSDDLGKVGEKGDDVVLDLALDLIDAGNVEGRVLALGPDRLRRLLRHDAKLGKRIGRVRLDLEPDAKPRLRIPDRGHLGAAVARNHRAVSIAIGDIARPEESRNLLVSDRGRCSNPNARRRLREGAQALTRRRAGARK